MTPARARSLAVRVALVVIGAGIAGVAGVVVACDPRPTLAQSGFFDDVRSDLVSECCACLSRRGTDDPTATCSPAELVDGVPVVTDDDAVFGDPDADQLDDLDDDLDPGEVPCLCEGDAASCVDRLVKGEGVVVPGACIDQLTRTAPCENECRGVLNFDPIAAEE